MATRRQVLKGLGVTLATTAVSGHSIFAKAVPDRLVDKSGRYCGPRYQAWTPLAPYGHMTFIQRFEGRSGHDFKIVGVSLHGGPMNFTHDGEAQSFLQAIHDAHLVECERIRADHATGAEKAIAVLRERNLSHDPALIRANRRLMAEQQIAAYKSAVRDIIKERAGQIGPSHATLALHLHSEMNSEKIGV